MRTTLRRIGIGAAGAAMVMGSIAVPAIAERGTAASGELIHVADLEGLPESALSGHAQIVRTGTGAAQDGKTHVRVVVAGLRPGVTYGVHLHNAPCSAGNPGGGHYQHEVGGAVTPPNEAWPSSSAHDPQAGITANADGVASGQATASWIARPEGQSVVVHAGVGHGATSTAGGPKLACADLG